jgi:hypothetical protein
VLLATRGPTPTEGSCGSPPRQLIVPLSVVLARARPAGPMVDSDGSAPRRSPRSRLSPVTSERHVPLGHRAAPGIPRPAR